MRIPSADEPPIDRSRDHVLEEYALRRALALAGDAAMRARVQDLVARRALLMAAREAFHAQATARRHARGEIYSAARVASLNAMVPSREALERDAERLYGRHGNARDVMKTHARVHYGNVLMASRLNLAHVPADIRSEARTMQAEEEAFANAWLAAIDEPEFVAEIRASQRDALRHLRTATRPMFLATRPRTDCMDDDDAAALGKAWNRLDDLASELGVATLSQFIAVPGEEAAAGVAPAQILTSVQALCAALALPAHKMPGKRATLACLERIAGALRAMHAPDALAWFDVDL